MAGDSFFYELSEEADNDLNQIFDYTFEQFGDDQAIKYLMGLDEVFENLCRNLKLGRVRNELRNGLRSISHESHTIFYRIIEDRIRIVRVLHGSRDIVKFLPPTD